MRIEIIPRTVPATRLRGLGQLNQPWSPSQATGKSSQSAFVAPARSKSDIHAGTPQRIHTLRITGNLVEHAGALRVGGCVQGSGRDFRGTESCRRHALTVPT